MSYTCHLFRGKVVPPAAALARGSSRGVRDFRFVASWRDLDRYTVGFWYV